MRVYELAEELDVSSNDVLDVLNNQLDRNVDNHMNAVEESIIPDVKRHLSNETDSTGETNYTIQGAVDAVIDTSSLGIGIALLMTPGQPTERRSQLREEIKELGREVTQPIRENLASALQSITSVSRTLGSSSEKSQLVNGDQIRDLIQRTTESMAGQVVEKTIQSFDNPQSLLSNNGTVKK